MTIEIRASEVYALANRLAGAADVADEAAAHLLPPPRLGDGALQAAAEAFFADHRLAAGALAGELRTLAGRVTAVADSWLHVDGELLVAGGRASLR